MSTAPNLVQIRPSNSNPDEGALRLNAHIQRGTKTPFVLVHGLTSNARTWDGVAERLAEHGHTVVAIDQRGHGLSDKPDHGYTFETVTEDLLLLCQALKLERPILVGQSWGGNVALAFGARYPDVAQGIGFVDGGYIDLQLRPDSSWERISKELRPPNLLGTPRSVMKERFASFHPDWDEAGIEGSLANFETLPDGTIRPWLTLERHMQILRALWEQRPSELYPQVKSPVLIAAASNSNSAGRANVKQQQVEAATQGLASASIHWFENTDHDIHVHRPETLAQLFIDTYESGIWAKE